MKSRLRITAELGLAAFALFLIFYTLSLAPAVWLAHHGYVSNVIVECVYAPLIANWSPLKDAMRQYAFTFSILVDGP